MVLTVYVGRRTVGLPSHHNGGMAKKIKKSKVYRRPDNTAPTQPAAAPTPSPSSDAKSNPMLLISAGLFTAVFLFVYYHVLTLNQMTDLSNGLAMPDQRIFGYTLSDIQALKSVMDDDAVGQLNYLHKTAGLLFPLIAASFSMLALARWIPVRKQRWLAFSAPLLFAVSDIVENFVIDALFTGDPTSGAVFVASLLTTVRWVTLLITAALVVGFAIRRILATMRAKIAEAQG